ncbi:hypothetical protein MKX01_035513 [Papaver californicum]|nr:hypothetical protein MKX01_035513 [Papaver californicum]
MGSKSKKIDPCVGSLVWVRRRNGSWWPGRIMGLHELPDACVISAKNQTPVKFLGRDNANLDWYNLDTSRRVKAFHCAEFRDCIEKAKASKGGQVMVGSKRAVKYARREDAILHALELERESETQKHEVDTRADGGTRKEQVDVDAEGNKQELTQSGISFEDPNDSTLKLCSLLKKRRKTPNDSEDDGNEGTKRMRGIEDLVNGVEAKGKANVNCKTEESVPVNTPSINEPMEEDKLTHVFNSKSSYSYLKKKTQNQVASICETLKRKYRRRQLRKVLENSTLVSVPIFCDDGSGSVPSYYQEIKDRKDSVLDSTMDSSVLIYSSKDYATGLCQKQTSPDASESRNSELSSISENPEDDLSDSSLFDVPFVDGETHCGSLPLATIAPKQFFSGQSSQVKSIFLSSEGLDRYGSTSFTMEHINSSRKTKKGTSKWQLKGKRNSRNLGKKTSDILGNSENRDVEADDFLPGTSHMDELCIGTNPEVHANTLDESFLSEDDGEWSEHDDDDVADPSYDNSNKFKKQRSKKKKVKMSALGRGGKFMSLSTDKSVVAKPQTEGSLAVLYLTDPRSASHHQSFFLGNSRNDVSDVSSINFQWGSSLFDVNLEVRASYSGQNVPLVSLMSKFSGKAIVGHPLTVEVCSNGYCDILLNSVNYSPIENFSEQSLDVEDEAVVGTLKAETGLYFPRKKPAKHSTFKSKKKSSKSKKNGITSKKTRSLSSFSGLPKQDAGRQTLVEKLKGDNVMACIPLTIVFSRINESLS